MLPQPSQDYKINIKKEHYLIVSLVEENSPRNKEWVIYVTNFDKYLKNWYKLNHFVLKHETCYFDSFLVEHIPMEKN